MKTNFLYGRFQLSIFFNSQTQFITMYYQTICLKVSIFRINDRVITANNNSLEGVDYATAVQVLRDSGQSVNLVVKRRLVLPPTVVPNNNNTNGVANNANSVSSNPYNHHQNQNTNLTTTQFNPNMKVTLMKSNKKKDDFGLVLGCKIYIKQIMNASLADKEDNLSEGDILNSINGISLGMYLFFHRVGQKINKV